MERNLLATLLLTTLGAAAQGPPVIVHARALGGSNTDFISGIAPAPDGGAMLVGFVDSNNGDVSGNHGQFDGWLVHVGSDGLPVWQRCLGGNLNDQLYGILPRPGGGYLVYGSTWSNNNGDVGTNHGPGADAWVVALNDAGVIQWQRLIGGTGNDQLNALQPTADGGYIGVGQSGSNDGDVGSNAGADDVFIFKLDATGAVEWTRTYGGSAVEAGYRVTQLAGGGYAVAGFTQSADGDVVGHHGGQDVWVLGLDAAGELLWQRAWGGTSHELARDILPDASGGCIVSLFTWSTDGDIVAPGGSDDSFLLGFDATGDIQWQRQFGTSAPDSYGKMLRTADGGLLLFGGYWACEVKKLDPAFEEEWTFTDGGLTHAQPTDGFLTADGGVWMIGSIASGPSSIPNFHGPTDGYVMELTFNYDLIRGNSFVDLDSDGVQDVAENSLVHHLFHIAGTDRMDLSDQAGDFELSLLEPGTCSTEPAPLAHYTSAPAAHTSNFTVFGEVDDTPVFAMQPNGVVNDLSVRLVPVGPFRLGFWAQYHVLYKNEGTTTQQSTLVVHPDPHLIFVGSNPAPTSTTDSLVWELGDLGPLEQGGFYIMFEVAMSAPVYAQANSTLDIWPLADDVEPGNNHASGPVTYSTSCDPNVIHVDRAIVEPADIGSTLALEYTIEFQNTGNDTAFTVLLDNPWPQGCDMGSFQFVGASHPVAITMDGEGGRTWFRFDNILLPDSTTNELRSHGFVRYRIRPNADLAEGDEMLNNAGIYFDLNAAVLTNTAVTVVGSTAAIAEPSTDAGFTVSPNPVTGTVYVHADKALSDARIIVLDAVGRAVLQRNMPGTFLELVLGGLAPGPYVVLRNTHDGASATRVLVE
ncbi:MAG: hypothetical protein JNL43_00120 [Flavobacteriales bacterium]|nr:hypothetical protein [Flavobacteriales bacterium]